MSLRTVAVVLSVDEADWLRRSLPAVVGQCDVLVVDNACSDDSAAVAERLGTRVVHLDERVSYCAAMNAGLRACADADAVLLLNADCVVRPGFVEALVTVLEGDPSVGSVAPKLLRDGAEEEIDAAGMTIDRRRKNSLVGHGAAAERFAVRAPCFGGDGAAVLYRRATLDACTVGGAWLDEDFALWASDADLAWRAQRLGWTCVYEPAAVGVHKRFYSPSTRAQVAPEHRRLQFRNRLLMILRNDRPGRDLPVLLAWEVVALGHALLRERSLLGAYGEAWRLRRRITRSPGRRRAPFGLRPPA